MENKRNEIVYESEINKIMLNKRTRKNVLESERVMNDKKVCDIHE